MLCRIAEESRAGLGFKVYNIVRTSSGAEEEGVVPFVSYLCILVFANFCFCKFLFLRIFVFFCILVFADS